MRADEYLLPREDGKDATTRDSLNISNELLNAIDCMDASVTHRTTR